MKAVKKSKILLVDDDRQFLKEVGTHLAELGYNVATAEDGHTGLKLAQVFNPNLVVLDLDFPDLIKPIIGPKDGLEVLQRLRETVSIPVIIVSATKISAVKEMALALGANDFIPKPFDLRELRERIAVLLSKATGLAHRRT